MSKLKTLFTLALLLSFLLTYAAARPDPAFHGDSPLKSKLQDVEAEKAEYEESCEGVGKEECLMRRTLAAHLDYIYTQEHKP